MDEILVGRYINDIAKDVAYCPIKLKISTGVIDEYFGLETPSAHTHNSHYFWNSVLKISDVSSNSYLRNSLLHDTKYPHDFMEKVSAHFMGQFITNQLPLEAQAAIAFESEYSIEQKQFLAILSLYMANYKPELFD